MGKENDGYNGPYSWGNGPRPTPKGRLAKLIAKLAKLATDPKGK